MPNFTKSPTVSKLPLYGRGKLRRAVRTQQTPRDDVLRRGGAEVCAHLDRDLVGFVLRVYFIHSLDLFSGHEAL